MDNLKKFVEERNKAILSLDREKIEKYAKKYGVKLPDDETIFWAGVHKAVIGISSATEQQKESSKKWLIEHGFRPYIA